MHSSRMRTARSSSRLLGVSASVHAGIHLFPPGLGLNTPWVWAWRPPQPDPSTSNLAVGLGKLPARPLNLHPWCGPGNPHPLNFHPGCGPADSPSQPDPSTSTLGVGLQSPPPVDRQTRVKT